MDALHGIQSCDALGHLLRSHEAVASQRLRCWWLTLKTTCDTVTRRQTHSRDRLWPTINATEMELVAGDIVFAPRNPIAIAFAKGAAAGAAARGVVATVADALDIGDLEL